MANGRLGVADLAATTDTSIYIVPATLIASVTVSIVNRNASAATIRLAIVDGAVGALANEDYIEYDVNVPANGILERTGIVMSTAENIVVRSSLANVSVRVHGFEE